MRRAYARNNSQAATTICPEAVMWFHFSGVASDQIENPAKSARLMTSCVPFAVGAREGTGPVQECLHVCVTGEGLVSQT